MKNQASWSILATEDHDFSNINQLDKSTTSPHQPADVVSGCAENCMHGITDFALQPIAIHSVIVLKMTEHRLNGLAAF